MFIVYNDFYECSEDIFLNISPMEFIDCGQFQVLPDFPMVNDNHEKIIKELTNIDVKILTEKCLFKKYKPDILFDYFDESVKLMAMVVFKPCEIKFWKYNETNSRLALSIDDFEKYNNNVTNFTLINNVKLSANDLIIFNPYSFRSIDTEMVQTLYFGD